MTWHDTGLTRALNLRLPIIQAPMAGGCSTPRLAAAVSAAGGLGCVAGAMLGPDELRAAIREVRALTDAPFAVNLFAPQPSPSPDRVEQWSRLTGVAPGPLRPPVRVDDQLDVVTSERVPVFSFTFGIPPLDDVAAYRIGTATTVAEALALYEAGADAVIAQGYEAGGHRGTFLDPVERSLIGTMALVPQIAAAIPVPVIASGGIMTGHGIAAALALGAQGVQLGTAFLPTDEAGTSAAHRRALGRPTTITSVLTGRPARAVRTPLVERLEASGVRPPDYPLPRSLSPEPPMLAGQAAALARPMPAGDLVATLARETTEVISALAR
jgi:nitronate monooxygenase